MIRDNAVEDEKRAVADYRLALGMELKSRRTAAEHGFADLSEMCNIPVETLRSYERGTAAPQLTRLSRIANTYGVSALDLLMSAAEYIYRAHGEPIPDRATVPHHTIALRAVLLYCGVLPAQLLAVESRPVPRADQGHPGLDTRRSTGGES